MQWRDFTRKSDKGVEYWHESLDLAQVRARLEIDGADPATWANLADAAEFLFDVERGAIDETDFPDVAV